MLLNRVYKLFIFLFLALFLFACNRPSQVNKTTMSKVYVDVMVAQETYLPDFKLLKKEKSKIFKKYNITEKDYNYTLSEYGTNEEEWDELFKNSLAYLDTLRKHNLTESSNKVNIKNK
ncbi:MAG: DUF4296 domain-containing protein [bacterium]